MKYQNLPVELAESLGIGIDVYFLRVDKNLQGQAISIRAATYLHIVGTHPVDSMKLQCFYHDLPHDSEIYGLVKEYCEKRLHWSIIADWLDAHPNELKDFPLWLRYMVGPAFRDYHTARESEQAGVVKATLQPA